MNFERASYQDIFVNENIVFKFKSTFQPKRILVTGAQGMIGNAIACSLQELRRLGLLQTTEIVLASRKWEKYSIQEYSAFSGLRLISNSEITEIGKIDLVIHTASPSNITRIESLHQLRQANAGFISSFQKIKPERLVYLSSGEVYKGESLIEGDRSGNFSELERRDWYPIAKLEAEDRLQDLASTGELSAQIIRLFHTFGPGVKSDDGRSFADILWGAVTNGEIALKSHGEQIRTFLYLADAVTGIIAAALFTKEEFRIFNLGSDTPVSILEFAQMTARITNSKILFIGNEDYIHSPNDYIVPKISNIYDCGWAPRIDLETGIRRTANWIQNSIPKLK